MISQFAFSKSILSEGYIWKMKIFAECCYSKFSIETLLKLHFIEAIRSTPHRDWFALVMSLWGRTGDPEVSGLTRFFVVLQKRSSTKIHLKRAI